MISSKNGTCGIVKVAKYFPRTPLPITPGFKNIQIHSGARGFGRQLSPFILKNEKGQLIENVWQFSKFYDHVNKQRIYKSRYSRDTIVWEHPREFHAITTNNITNNICDNNREIIANININDDNKEPNSKYWAWREKGMNNQYPVRYPNGYAGRNKCICSILGNKKNYKKLGYIEARKKIYCAEFIKIVPHIKEFKEMQVVLRSGTNIQLIEYDGPDYRLNYYPYNLLSSDNKGITITKDVILHLLNDETKPFGHGYVIASLLLGGKDWLK